DRSRFSTSARAGRLELAANEPPTHYRPRGGREAGAEVRGDIDCHDSEKDDRIADPAAVKLPLS
ncbi:MAG: hypothetical protein ACUVXB_17960, partial [Bryobacteraceae bacterium]